MNLVRLAVALSAVLALATPARAQEAHDIEKVVEKNPLAADQPFRVDEVARTDAASVHVAQVRGEVPRQYHAAHDETVFIHRGKGVLTVGDKTILLEAGEVVHIPRRVVHGFKSEGAEPVVALLVFEPAFDGKDRFFEGAGAEAAEPELNRMLRELAVGLQAEDVDLLSGLLEGPAKTKARGEFGPEERAKLAELVAELRAAPYFELGLHALEGFPLVGGFPPGATEFEVRIETAEGPDAVRFELELKAVGERLFIDEFDVKPQSEEGKRAKGGTRADAAKLYAGMSFERTDPTDLKEVLRVAATVKPALAVLVEPFPSVRGLWGKAATVTVSWRIPGKEERLRVRFEKGPSGWAVH